MKKFTAILLAIVLFVCAIQTFLLISSIKGCAATEELDLEIKEMKVNGLTEPLGIDTTPVFSWQNNSSGFLRSMSAYRIVVASTSEKAEKFEGDLWDSGKIQGEDNYDIVYEGNALSSVTDYYWRVTVYDENDNSYNSPVAHFGTGMVSSGDWTASWIGVKSEKVFTFDGASWIWSAETQKEIPSCTKYFRKTFTPDSTKTIKKVYVGGTADDSLVMYYNGQKIASSSAWASGFFADITDLTVSGSNTFSAKVSNTYTEGYASYAALIVKAQIYYTDGTVEEIVTDGSWVLNAEESTDWTAIGFDDSAWTKATVVGAYPVKPWNSLNIDATILSEDESAPMLRKEFSISKDIKNAKMLICGLGLFELKINGTLPDDTVLNPAHTQYDDTVNYRVFDVTSLISTGENAIAVELGNSWYNENFEMWSIKNAIWRDNPKLLAELHITYADGTKDVIVTDTSWKVSLQGPTVYNSIYHGENYDARLEIENWDKASFDDSSWNNAIIAATPGALKFQNMEPMRRLDTLKAEIAKLSDGTYVAKVPVMTTGWAKITFRESVKGETVNIAYGETLKTDGTINYVDWGTSYTSGGPFQIFNYTCKGVKNESYEPKFTYCGYQYIQITGYSGTLTSDDIECYLIANDVEKTAEFETDNALINTLHDNMARALINNFQGKPTDCPTWEKLGWTGDYNVVAKSAMYNYGIQAFNQKFMNDIRDTSVNGNIGNTSPAAGGNPGNTVVWNAAYIESIYESWKKYGTLELARDHYDLMRANALSHITTIQSTTSSTGLTKASWVFENEGALNDWQGPNGPSSAPEGSGIIATAMYYSMLTHLKEMALALGHTDDATEYAGYIENIYTAFNEAFYNEEKGYYETGYWNSEWAGTRSEYRQTSNLAPIYYGLCPAEHIESVVKSIADDVISKDYHLETGHVGTRMLLPVLSEYGYGDIAYKLVTQTTYPSWGYWVENGATSCWEGYPVAGTRSRNHYFLGTYDQWFFENLAGIADHSEGYKTVTIKPEMVGDLTKVDCTLKTIRGTLTNNWKKYTDGTIEMVVTVPTGTTATIYVPVASENNLRVNGVLLNQQKGILGYDVIDGNVVITAGSGTYEFVNSSEFEDTSNAKAELQALIDSLNNLDSSNYDSSAWEAFAPALEEATSVLNSADATEVDYTVARIKLNEQFGILNRNKSGNLALNATVTTGGELDHPHWNNPQTLTDGDLKNYQTDRNTGWCCTGYQEETYVIIDLGAIYNVNSVYLYGTGNTDTDPSCKWFPKSYDILVSTNNETWNKVGGKTGISADLVADENGVGPCIKSYFTATTARYIKIDITELQDKSSTGTWYAQLAEIQVHCLKDAEYKFGTLIESCYNVSSSNYREDAYPTFINKVDKVNAGVYLDEEDFLNAISVLEEAKIELNKYTNYNLALNTTVTASTSHANGNWNDPQRLVDGDRINLSSSNQHTGWSSTSADATPTLDIDLGDIFAINTVNLYPTGCSVGANSTCTHFPKGYTIQVSTDGRTWNTVYTATDLSQPVSDASGNVDVITNKFSIASARFVRIQVTQKHSTLAQISEIEVFNVVTDKITGANLELGSTLTVNYYADSELNVEDLTMRFTSSSGKITEVQGALDGSTGYYKFAYTGINPQCMNDTIKAELMSGDYVLSVKENYSVKEYAENTVSKSASDLGLTNTQYQNLKTLLADVLTYGAAQEYMKYNTDNPANASSWVEEFKSDFTSPAGVKNITGNKDENNKVKSASLNISHVNKIYFRLILTDESVKVLLNGVEVDRNNLALQDDGTYLLYTDDLKATEFDKVFTLTLVDLNESEISKVEYNMLAYIEAKHESPTVGNIAKALNNYGASAKTYINSLNDKSNGFNLDEEDNLM